MIRLVFDRPLSTWIACGALVTLGTISLFRLPLALLPAIERPRLIVGISAPERSREQLLRGIVEPYEQRLASLAGVRSIRSETNDGRALLVAETDWHTDADELQIAATRRLEDAGDFRPEELSVHVTAGDRSPTIEVGVVGGNSAGMRSELVQNILRPELARIEGAGRIDVVGSKPVRIVVRPRAADLAARRILPAQLAAALGHVGQTASAGRVREGAHVRPLVISEELESLESLGNLLISSPSGMTPLREVASIRLEEVDDGSAFRWNGKEGALVRIYRSPGANAVSLARNVRDAVEAISRQSRTGFAFVLLRDRSLEVIAALRELALAALLGIFFGTLLLRYMLGRWGPTLSLSIVIPASLLASFAAFFFFGVPLDVVSLAGLALAGGMLVDNSIVVLESIEAARRKGSSNPALEGTRQIAKAVVASCLTTVIVFVPLIYLRGLARAFFGEQAFAIGSALVASLLFSLTLTPLLSRFDKSAVALREGSAPAGASPGLSAYESALRRCLDSPRPVLAAAIIVTLASLAAGLALRRELFPREAANRIRIDYKLPPELAPEEMARRSVAFENQLIRIARLSPGGDAVSMRGFSNEERGAGEEIERGRGQLELSFDGPASARAALPAIDLALRSASGIQAVSGPAPSAFAELLGEETKRIEITATARDESRAERLAGEVVRKLTEAGRPASRGSGRAAEGAFFVEWDESRLASLRLSRERLEEQLRRAIEPTLAGRATIRGVALDLQLERITPSDLRLIPVALAADGRSLPLSALAQVKLGARSDTIHREDQRHAVRIETLAPHEGSTETTSLAGTLAAVPLGAGDSISIGGEAVELDDAFRQLRLAFILSLVLVFLTIGGAYESLVVPALVMTAVPVAAGGGLLALLVTRQSLNIMSSIGLILLSGIVVNHTIVLVDRIEQLRGAGVKEDDAIRAAGSERYRPILMTTLTTLFGMIPLAILGGDGVELRRAVSIAVIGGLVTSTFASLLVVPLLHRSMEPFRKRDDAAPL